MAVEEQAEEQAQGDSNGAPSGLSRIFDKGVLVPVAATALTAAAASIAAKKAPDIKNKLVGEASETAQDLGREATEGAKDSISQSPLGGLAGAASKVIPGKGGSRGGSKKTRRLPIQRWTDVGAPVEDVYEKWTQFEEYPKFMHRVLEVKSEDDDTVEWQEKIWFSKRQWKAEITDRRENERIAWKTVSGMTHHGVVSFHRLDDNLTRVLVTVDFQPTGMMEKMASGLRFVKRAVQADLARFKAYVEFDEAEGLEYAAAPEDTKGGEKEDSDGDEGDARARRNGSNGSNNGSREDSEKEREEREARRRERREATASR